MITGLSGYPMQNFKSYLILILLMAMLAGCTVAPADAADQIMGTWRSEVGGFEITSTYTAAEVTVTGHAGMAYSLDGDRLVIGGDDTTVRIVSFPAEGQMIQLDPMTGTQHIFMRSGM